MPGAVCGPLKSKAECQVGCYGPFAVFCGCLCGVDCMDVRFMAEAVAETETGEFMCFSCINFCDVRRFTDCEIF